MTPEIEDYRDRLSGSRWYDVDEWRAILVEGVKLLQMTEEQCAKMFNVSRPSVHRWLEGENQPVEFMREFVVKCLLEHISGLEKDEK